MARKGRKGDVQIIDAIQAAQDRGEIAEDIGIWPVYSEGEEGEEALVVRCVGAPYRGTAAGWQYRYMTVAVDARSTDWAKADELLDVVIEAVKADAGMRVEGIRRGPDMWDIDAGLCVRTIEFDVLGIRV